MTRSIPGTNRKDDSFTEGIINIALFFIGFGAVKKHLLWQWQHMQVISCCCCSTVMYSGTHGELWRLLLESGYPRNIPRGSWSGECSLSCGNQIEIQNRGIQSAHTHTCTHTYPDNTLGSWCQTCLIEVHEQHYFAIQQSINCTI